MLYQLELIKNKGYTWEADGYCFVKGYAWIENVLYDGKGLLALWNRCESFVQLLGLIKKMNGIFSGIWQDDKYYYLISDPICVFPLFYCKKQATITDDGYGLSCKLQKPVYDELCIAETVASAAHSCGDRTWYENIKQTMAGEILILPKNGGKEEHIRYHSHALHGKNKKVKIEDYFNELDELSYNVFQRIIRALDGRTAIIPLSGGCDSRYIAVMLHKLKYENVVCFTYGKKDSFEVHNSRKIANVLGYSHFFVEYNNKIFLKLFGKDIWKYKEHATRLSNLVHVQDYFALKELIKNSKFPKKGVMLPGHSGDMYGGTHDFDDLPISNKYSDLILSRAIYDSNYCNLKNWEKYRKRIEKNILELLKLYGDDIKNIEQLNSKNNCYDISHRQAQFICNSVRVYDYFSYEYMLPFYDNEMEMYWNSIPIQYRKIPSLYHTYLLKHLFPQYGLFLDSDREYFEGARCTLTPKKRSKQRKAIHWSLEFILLKYNINLRFWNSDVNNFTCIEKKLYQDIKNKRIISFLHSDFNNLLTIRDMEYLLRDGSVLTKVLGR